MLLDAEKCTRKMDGRFTTEEQEKSSYDGHTQTFDGLKAAKQETHIRQGSYHKIHKDLSAQHESLQNKNFPFANDLGTSCLNGLARSGPWLTKSFM